MQFKERLNKFKNNWIGKVDLSLGFDYKEDNRYLRLPLWMISLFEPDSDFEAIQVRIKEINDKRLENRKRNLFITQISRHDMNGIRGKIINTLKDIGQIDCAGNFMKNTDDLQTKFNDNKIAFLENYTFNICPENSASRGYITEKLIDAFKAGCIPIYWSKNNLLGEEFFNEEAILIYDENNPTLLKDRVAELWQDEKAYLGFIETPIFKQDAAEKIWETFNQLSDKLKKVIDKE